MLSVIERARRYIATCPPAISGQGGHDATFRVACLLVHGFALGEADALALLHEYNAGCVPPWSEAELVHKVKSAATAQHQQPKGWLLGEECPVTKAEAPHPGPLPKAERVINPVVVTEKFLNGFGCAEQDLIEASPVRLEGEWKFDGRPLSVPCTSRGNKSIS